MKPSVRRLSPVCKRKKKKRRTHRNEFRPHRIVLPEGGTSVGGVETTQTDLRKPSGRENLPPEGAYKKRGRRPCLYSRQSFSGPPSGLHQRNQWNPSFPNSLRRESSGPNLPLTPRGVGRQEVGAPRGALAISLRTGERGLGWASARCSVVAHPAPLPQVSSGAMEGQSGIEEKAILNSLVISPLCNEDRGPAFARIRKAVCGSEVPLSWQKSPPLYPPENRVLWSGRRYAGEKPTLL